MTGILLVTFGTFAWAVHKGWIVTKREYDAKCRECEAMRVDRDKWLDAALHGARVTQDLGDTTRQLTERVVRQTNGASD